MASLIASKRGVVERFARVFFRHTVGGINPAPRDMVDYPIIYRVFIHSKWLALGISEPSTVHGHDSTCSTGPTQVKKKRLKTPMTCVCFVGALLIDSIPL